MPYALSFVILAATIVTLIDIIVRDSAYIRHLPKLVWMFIVLLAPIIGIVIWWVVGREPLPTGPERGSRFARRAPSAAQAPVAPAPRHPVGYRSTEDQLADLEREIEEDRLRAELARRRRERDERTDAGGTAAD